jgi:hypothetical protein
MIRIFLRSVRFGIDFDSSGACLPHAPTERVPALGIHVPPFVCLGL